MMVPMHINCLNWNGGTKLWGASAHHLAYKVVFCNCELCDMLGVLPQEPLQVWKCWYVLRWINRCLMEFDNKYTMTNN